MRVRARFLLLLPLLACACVAQQQRIRSSVVDYLYPEEKDVVVHEAVPTLKIPARVGIAFVPDAGPQRKGDYNFWTGPRPVRPSTLTEADKARLMETVANHFRQYDFVKSIDIVPTAYLRAYGGFENLDQVRSMQGVDIIALVSYDQMQFTDEGALSATYWTLIGPYVVAGEKNDTQTLMDTAVFDIASRQLLFRAPGVSAVKGHATPINLAEELRTDSAEGLKLANDDMIKNLDAQLGAFRQKVKDQPQEYKVVATPAYQQQHGGSGFLDAGALAVLLGGLLLRASLSRREPQR